MKKEVPKFTQKELDDLLDGFNFPNDLDDILPKEENEIERLEKIIEFQYQQIKKLKEINNVLMGIKPNIIPNK